MELTTGQQRLLFVVVVLALAGLGFYLIRGHGSGGSPGAAPSSSPSVSPSATLPSATGTASASVPPATVPAATPVSTAGGAEIYQWLPFTPSDLAAAAKTTLEFATDYTTWSYTEDTAAYAAKLNGLVTADEMPILESAYATPGVAGQRTADKQVSKGSGTIDSIYAFAHRHHHVLCDDHPEGDVHAAREHAERQVCGHGRLVGRRLAGRQHRTLHLG